MCATAVCAGISSAGLAALSCFLVVVIILALNNGFQLSLLCRVTHVLPLERCGLLAPHSVRMGDL